MIDDGHISTLNSGGRKTAVTGLEAPCPPQSVFHVKVRRKPSDPAYACSPTEAGIRSLKALRSTLAKRAPGRRPLK